ncbi:glutamate--tRNA ligase [Zavarzinia aquatilis]|uniref:Glutamate--tRNA ligase n=1 Tax=Zavarzinia aquatilis TaxID=2211142 RepID=A0A317EKW1_9PROT|nr:glutamate--tRNA ligase [Zavarzinia aquatilis]PWR25835.1 glutamate--tRNA ligase [Zavarzinia aquatilis]
MSSIITRFAPSPTGYLHIGGARTALFNWLFARHFGGTFRLRIEDTDRQRSTDDAIEKIFEGMRWLGLDWDGDVVHQFARAPLHAAQAQRLIAEDKAYYCYCTPEELTAMREDAKAKGLPPRYNGYWRDRDPAEAPAGVKPTVRLKAPREGETVIGDLVQGEVRFPNTELDDMILLRSDGTPTYMLSVVVDDHDMNITHVIRGDDHLTNTARQTQLYLALGWDVPAFAHIPLIHGPDGAKLSKRHGALGVDAYRDLGYLPEAMRNYLLRLGWSHGDDETISTEQAIEWFGLESVGRSPARFDFAKLDNLNGHYLRVADNTRLAGLVAADLAKAGIEVDATGLDRIAKAMDGLKARAKTLVQLTDSARFLVSKRPLALDARAEKILSVDGKDKLAALRAAVADLDSFSAAQIEGAARAMAEAAGAKLGDFAQPLRAALSGSNVSPPIFEVAEILGRVESLGRIDDALGR